MYSLQVGNTTIGLQSDKTNSQQYPYKAILYFQECTRYPSVSLSKLIFFDCGSCLKVYEHFCLRMEDINDDDFFQDSENLPNLK